MENKKIKVIDLLNIAIYNDKNLPNKIKYNDIEYEYSAGTYRNKEFGHELWYDWKILFILNNYVEIIEEDILDDKEKEYLSAVIRPFRDEIEYISKYRNYGEEYIFIQIRKHQWTTLPCLKSGEMYKGMDEWKHYSLEELGL